VISLKEQEELYLVVEAARSDTGRELSKSSLHRIVCTRKGETVCIDLTEMIPNPKSYEKAQNT